MALEVEPEGCTETWILDSGASAHITGNLNLFSDIRVLPSPYVVRFGNNTSSCAHISGTVLIPMGDREPLMLKEVLFCEGVQVNLISPQKLAGPEGSISLNMTGLSGLLDGEGRILCSFTYEKPVWKLLTNGGSISTSNETCLLSQQVDQSNAHLWHQRLGHVSNGTIEKMAKHKAVRGLEEYSGGQMPVCEPCLAGKMTRTSFPLSKTNISSPLERVSMDLSGPFDESIGGSKYLFLIIDNKSRMMFVYFLKHKDEAFERFRHFHAQASNITMYNLKNLHSDNGGEFDNSQFAKYCSENGIHHTTNVPYNPEQNGLAEKYISILVNDCITLLQQANLPKRFWAEALHTACYVRNRTSCSHTSPLTPFEIFYGEKPDVSHLRVFGCVAYAHVPKALRRKLDPKGIKCIFVGYSDNQKGYRVYDPSRDKVFTAISVYFAEDHFDFQGVHLNGEIDLAAVTSKSAIPKLRLPVVVLTEYRQHKAQSLVTPHVLDQTTMVNRDLPSVEEKVALVHSSLSNGQLDQITTTVSNESPPQCDTVLYTYHGQRVVNSPTDADTDGNGNPDIISYSASSDVEPLLKEAKLDIFRRDPLKEPETIEEALTLPEASHWIAATDDEILSMLQHDAWTLVPLDSIPTGRNVVGCRWVFKVKYLPSGEIERFKARLVAQGFTQREGEDYFDTYAPTVKHVTLRILLALAVDFDLEVHQLDIKTAFLNGDLEEEIFMKQPPGYQLSEYPDQVCRLNRSIYGLKQSPRAWRQKMASTLAELGFVPCNSDPGLFVNKSSDWFLVILLYVDDLLIFGQRIEDIVKIKRSLCRAYELTDKGEISFFLGMKFERDRERGTLFIHQRVLAMEIVSLMGQEDCKSQPTPLAAGTSLVKSQVRQSNKTFHSIIGKLLYLVVGTRPDLAYAISHLSRFLAYCDQSHMNALKHIIQYLKGTMDCGILFTSSSRAEGSSPHVHGYTDSDYGAEKDRKSIYAYLHYVNGNITSWSSKKQHCVAASTGEAEYIALSESIKDMIFIRNVLSELELYVRPVIYCDSQAALAIARTTAKISRAKHIDVRLHFVKDYVDRRIIEIDYVRSEDTPADALTKSVNPKVFAKHAKMMIALPPE